MSELRRNNFSPKAQVLSARLVTQFTHLWSDRGSGRRIPNVTLFRPVPPPGFHSLGDVARPYYEDQPKLTDDELPVYAVSEKDPRFPHFLRKPVDYHFIWNESRTRCKKPVSIWLPVPPPGFIALGCVVSLNHKKPSLDAVRCVHATLVQAAALSVDKPVWRDQGSGGRYDLSIYDIVPGEHIDKEYALLPGCMMAVGHYSTPTLPIFCLDKRCIMPEESSSLQQTGQTLEDNAPCPRCQGKGNFGIFGGCDVTSIHMISKCPMCEGKGRLPRGSVLCNSCDGLGGTSPFGKCNMISLHYKPCKCGGTGLQL